MPHSCGEILNNRYRIVKLLGQGGFGAVYRTWDMNLGKACALKENLDTTPEAVRQFSREALILSNLTHPNLPRVTDHFFTPGVGQYLVMDYIEGDDLQEKLDHSNRPLPERQAVSWIVQVLDALEYLHKQNPPVIHRDIKPLNIIITPEGKAVLVDFGIAKIYDPNLATTRGAQAVTPGYSPPEQYGQGKTNAMSDIYALGSTLYSLVTGMVAPASVDIVSGNALPPPAARECNPQVSQKTSSAIARAMQLNRLQRFSAAAEFKSALGKIPLVSPTPPPVQKAPAVTMPASRHVVRTVSPARRKLWWLPIGMLLLLILAGVFLAGAQGWLGSDHPTPTQTVETLATLVENTLVPTPSLTPTSSATIEPIIIQEILLTFTATMAPVTTDTPTETPSSTATQLLPGSTVNPQSTNTPRPNFTSKPQSTSTLKPPPTNTFIPPPTNTPKPKPTSTTPPKPTPTPGTQPTRPPTPTPP